MVASTKEEAQVQSWGFAHAFTWTDPPNAHYKPHSHDRPTTLFILNGELTIAFPEDEKYEKKVCRVGERVDIKAERIHEAWIGQDGCTYVIGE